MMNDDDDRGNLARAMKALLELPPETPGERRSIYRDASGRYRINIEMRPPFVAIEDDDDGLAVRKIPLGDGAAVFIPIRPGETL